MAAEAGPGAYFHCRANGFAPVPQARSPWSDDMLHGRLLAGLAARAVEQETPDAGLRVARLTVDLFRSPPMDVVTVAAHVARDGRRVRAVDVSMRSGGHEVGRAFALALRVGPHPPGAPWRPAEWAVPSPEDLPATDDNAAMGGWEIRPITPGGFWSATQKRVWTRDTWQLVAGEPLSPLVRAALASDLASPLANSGPEGLHFINADMTLSIRRPPLSEWIGLEVSAHLGQDGIAVGACTMYDVDGAIGWSSTAAVAYTPLVVP